MSHIARSESDTRGNLDTVDEPAHVGRADQTRRPAATERRWSSADGRVAHRSFETRFEGLARRQRLVDLGTAWCVVIGDTGVDLWDRERAPDTTHLDRGFALEVGASLSLVPKPGRLVFRYNSLTQSSSLSTRLLTALSPRSIAPLACLISSTSAERSELIAASTDHRFAQR
jgi:hypothetical protein